MPLDKIDMSIKYTHLNEILFGIQTDKSKKNIGNKINNALRTLINTILRHVWFTNDRIIRTMNKNVSIIARELDKNPEAAKNEFFNRAIDEMADICLIMEKAGIKGNDLNNVVDFEKELTKLI